MYVCISVLDKLFIFFFCYDAQYFIHKLIPWSKSAPVFFFFTHKFFIVTWYQIHPSYCIFCFALEKII